MRLGGGTCAIDFGGYQLLDVTTHDGPGAAYTQIPWAYAPPTEADRARSAERAAAEARALTLLEERLGKDAVAKVLAGGGYTIPSKTWPTVQYLVPKVPHERVKVLDRGSVVTEVCIVTTDGDIPWPDVMLQRVTAIQADESVLFATGVIHDLRAPGWAKRIAGMFRR